MSKGPLIRIAVILAFILIAMSFMLVVFPDSTKTIGLISGIVAACVIIVLLAMLIKVRRGSL